MVAHNTNRKRSGNECAGVTWPSADERGAMLYRVKTSNPNLISAAGYCSAGDNVVIGSAIEPRAPNLHTNNTNFPTVHNDLCAAKGRSIVEARKQKEIFNDHCSDYCGDGLLKNVAGSFQSLFVKNVENACFPSKLQSDHKAPPPTALGCFTILDGQEDPVQNHQTNFRTFNHCRENSFKNDNEQLQQQQQLNIDRPICPKNYQHDHCCPSSYGKFCRYFGGQQQQSSKNNNMASWPDVFNGHYSDSAVPQGDGRPKIFDVYPSSANKLMQQSIISNNNNHNNAYYYKSSTNEMDDGKSIQCKTQNLNNLILADDKKRSVEDDNSTKKMLLTLLNEIHIYDSGSSKDSIYIHSNDRKSRILLYYFCLVVCSFCLSISIITALCSFFRCYVCINLLQQNRKWNLVRKSCLHSILDICFFISIFCFLAALVIFMHLSSTAESLAMVNAAKMQSFSTISTADQRYNTSMKLAPIIVIGVLLGVGALICISLTARAIYHRLKSSRSSAGGRGVENSNGKFDENSDVDLSFETSDFCRNDKLSTLV
uniref:Uncharacterized protein n=1 Tax=Romanomermis culicivorax TaxID=13658 RepID=A0A915HPB7_ROMCU